MNKNKILISLFACCLASNPLYMLGQVRAVDLGLSVKWADRNLGSVENKHMNNTTGDYSFSWLWMAQLMGLKDMHVMTIYTLRLINGIRAD